MIGYGVAFEIFKLLEYNANNVSKEWNGELNVTYTYGGKLKDGR